MVAVAIAAACRRVLDDRYFVQISLARSSAVEEEAPFGFAPSVAQCPAKMSLWPQVRLVHQASPRHCPGPPGWASDH